MNGKNQVQWLNSHFSFLFFYLVTKFGAYQSNKIENILLSYYFFILSFIIAQLYTNAHCTPKLSNKHFVCTKKQREKWLCSFKSLNLDQIKRKEINV